VQRPGSGLRRASEFIDRIETGRLAVNLPTPGWDVHHPFGGFRESGSPFKEQGRPDSGAAPASRPPQ
jgi:aldehyde dehydrogenase (NAD+)